MVSEGFSHKAALLRCNLDGTACTFTDISAGQPANSAYTGGSLALDLPGGKLLYAARNLANSDLPSMYRCNLDGTGATHTNIAAGASPGSGTSPSLVVDVAAGHFLVATPARPNLFTCNLDASSCVLGDLSAGVPGSAFEPSAALDVAHHRLFIAGRSTTKKLGLFIKDL